MKTTSNKPSHRVYAVTKRGDKSYWAEAGVVWPHKDGKGFNLTLSLLPLNGQELVIREPQADGTAPTEASVDGGK